MYNHYALIILQRVVKSQEKTPISPIDKRRKNRYNRRMKILPNVEQRSVVDNLSDNILLFASAGTGKTFTVAHRVANALRSGLATAEQILCLTFTIKAANEMREDVANIVGEGSEKISLHTIHGFCYRLVKEEERLRSQRYAEPQVIDEVDEEAILQRIYLSKAAEYRLADCIEKQGLEITVEALKGLPLVEYNGRIGWMLKDGFLSRKADFQRIPAPIQLPEWKRKCPLCGSSCGVKQMRCEACDSPIEEFGVFPTEDPPRLFKSKKSSMMSIVTLIKHVREEKGLYSESLANDYQAAWDVIRKESPAAYQNVLSYYLKKWEQAGGSPLEVDASVESILSRHAGELIAQYKEELEMANQLDFDDLIIYANRYLSQEDVAEKYSNRYRYIIVDEMQDTSRLEYTLLKKLFSSANVMLCGDFFQTIYAWRGSSPESILEDFKTQFTPTVYAFKENYRATKTLANAGFGYLKNTYPAMMGIFASSEISVHSQEEGEKILCLGFDNFKEEAKQIYTYVQKHRPEKLNDLCIMARSNSYIARLSNEFDLLNASQKREEDKVRFFTVEKDHAFFKRACVKDVLAVLKLLINPTDRFSMERIAAKYVRGVGVKTVETLRNLSDIGVSVVTFLDKNAIRGEDPYMPLIEGAKRGEIVIYDTETTGLDLSKDEMVQLSAVRLNNEGEIVDTLDMMILPTVPIGDGAYRTHGFDLEYIRTHGGVDPKTALLRFAEFAKGAVLVGHNSLRFDSPLIARQLKEQGLPPLSIQGEYDTLTLAKQFVGGLPDYKLSTLCTHYGIVNEAAHNALGDITATAGVLWRMIVENVLPTAEQRQEAVKKYAPKFEKFFAFYEELQGQLQKDKVGEVAATVIERMRLKKAYPTEGDQEALKDVVDTLSMAAVYDGYSFLSSYLTDAALSGSQMDVLLKKLNKVPIITVHQSKGCEFSTVILAGMSDGVFPGILSKETGQDEEEKRVFYVAITRAKERLILTRVTKNYYSGKRIEPCPYVRNLPQEYLWTDGKF